MEEILIACVVEEMTIEEAAGICRVETEWFASRIDQGYLRAEDGRISSRVLSRARRMADLERNFDASPELAALFADLLDELDELRKRD